MYSLENEQTTGQLFIIPTSLNPFSLSLASLLHSSSSLKQNMLQVNLPAENTKTDTLWQKPRGRKKTGYYLNDRARWQAGVPAIAKTQSSAASWPGATEDEANSGIQR